MSSLHAATLIAMAALASAPAHAATIYAGKAGCSDSGSGSKAAPFCSPTKAAAGLKPGDTLALLGTTFSEQLVIKVSGTRQNPIVVTAAEGAKPVIDGSKLTFKDQGLILIKGQSHITIRGVTLKASPHHCALCVGCKSVTLARVAVDGCARGGLVFVNKSAKIVIRDSDLQATGKCGTTCGVNGAVSLGDTTDFEVTKNEIHDTVGEGVVLYGGSHKGTVHHNTVKKTGAASVRLNHAFAVSIYRNTLADSGSVAVLMALGAGATGTPETTNNHLFWNIIRGAKSHGVQFLPTLNGDMDRNFIYNNVFYKNGGTAVLLNNTDNNTVANNILAHHAKGGIAGNRKWENGLYNNLFFNSGKAIGEGSVSGDPLMSDPENGDYTISEDSPAIDAGYDMGLYFQHLPDIGAHEHVFEAGCGVAGQGRGALPVMVLLGILLTLRRRSVI